MTAPASASSADNIVVCDHGTVPPGSILQGLVLFISLFSLAGCSPGERPVTRDSLLAEYEVFTDSVEKTSELSIGELPAVVTRWHGLEDRLFSLMSDDSVSFDANIIAVTRMSSLGERVKERINRSVDASLHSYDELIQLQQKISLGSTGSAMSGYAAARDFFSSLPCMEVWPGASESESGYLDFLYRQQLVSFRTWDQIEEMLREEDELYQYYLYSSDWHPGETTEEIVIATNALMAHVADCLMEREEDSTGSLLAYMSVRTNRRLLLCASQALASIEGGSCTTLEEAVSCISSCMAPFIYFSPMLLQLRTEEQLSQMKELGRRLPGAFALLESRQLRVVSCPDSLPGRIIKDYVTYVINN